MAMTLEKYLAKVGKTLSQFAEELGYAPSVVHDWKTRRRTPRAEALAKIERKTDGQVLPSDFFPEAKV